MGWVGGVGGRRVRGGLGRCYRVRSVPACLSAHRQLSNHTVQAQLDATRILGGQAPAGGRGAVTAQRDEGLLAARGSAVPAAVQGLLARSRAASTCCMCSLLRRVAILCDMQRISRVDSAQVVARKKKEGPSPSTQPKRTDALPRGTTRLPGARWEATAPTPSKGVGGGGGGGRV